MRPPRAAEWLLLALSGSAQAEFVAGDLAEDFALVLAGRGHRAARRWYAGQVVRSAPALMALRMRSGELTDALLKAVLGVLLPLVALDRLWLFVYSQIPLKESLGRAPALLAANVLFAGLCSWAAASSPRATRPGLQALASMAAAALALCVSVGETPAVYVVCLLAAAPAHSWWSLMRRKLR